MVNYHHFSELINKDNSVTLHHRNIRSLAIETYKVIQGLSLPLLNGVFVSSQCIYDLRGNTFLERVKSVRFGTESISFLAPKVREILPNEIKESETLQLFKQK